MEPKISKAQIEVWEMKERAYEEIKHLPLGEALKLIHEQTKPIIEEIYRRRLEKQVKESESPAAA